MIYFGKSKNSVGLKPNAELRKDAKAPSAFIGAELVIQCLSSILNKQFIDNMLLGIEGALASFLNSALGFSPTLFLQLPRLTIIFFVIPGEYFFIPEN